MRIRYALLLIPLFGAPLPIAPLFGATALAETVAPPAAEHRGKLTAEERFNAANTTHDGHLTLDQAKTGYKSVARSFNQIDGDHHGYVTMDDIAAWKAAKRAAKRAAKDAAPATTPGVIRPGHAAQDGVTPKPIGTSTDLIVPMPARPRLGVDVPSAPLDKAHTS
jgi:hypothetical protein